MKNLWMFILLGFIAQRTHGCVQITFDAVEQLFAKSFKDYISNLKGKPLSDIDINVGPTDEYTAKLVIINDSNTSSVNTVFNREGKLSTNITGHFTISSDSFSDAVIAVAISLKVSIFIENGHFLWKWMPGSFLLSTQLINSVTSNRSTSGPGKEVYVTKCRLLISGLCEGVVHAVINAINHQCAKIKENIKYTVFICHYEVERYEYYYESIATYVVVHCENIGTLNDAQSLVLKKMKPDDITVTYVEQKLCTNFLAPLKVNYTQTITAVEWKGLGIFPNATGDLEISFRSDSLPACSISTAVAVATFSFNGSIQDASRNELCAFTTIVQADVNVIIINGLVEVSLGEAKNLQVNPTSVEGKDAINPLGFLISRISGQLVSNISCSIPSVKSPDPLGVKPMNAECSNEAGTTCCVEKKSVAGVLPL